MGGLIPESFIEELLGRVDIVELIERSVPLKRSGREFHACCPFHDEKTPSFTVSPQKQFYHCFGCGAHGDAIGFLMRADNLDFVEAVERLAGEAGITVPQQTPQERERRSPACGRSATPQRNGSSSSSTRSSGRKGSARPRLSGRPRWRCAPRAAFFATLRRATREPARRRETARRTRNRCAGR